jgi:Tol biopolymer transport system component/imidazolonepropionase-like amidohydrolase/ketosteroid isomerase-like protein
MGSSAGRSTVAVLFLLVAASACGGARPASQGSEPHEDRGAVESVVESWVSLFNAGEFENLAGLYTDGAWLISSSRGSSRFEDRSAIAEHFAPGLPEGIHLWVGDVEVDLYGDAATAIGPWGLTDPDGRLGEGYIACTPPQQPVQLSSPAPATVVFDTIEITVEEATNLTLDVSPDGRTIAFTLFDRLWLVPAEGGAARPVTGPGEYAAHAAPSAWPAPGVPAWSPDGEWLAYASPTGLRLLHPDRGERRQLTFQWDDSRPRWLSSQRVSFVARRAWPDERRGWPVGDPEIWVIDLPSGEQWPVSPRFQRLAGYAWSPDGRTLAVAGTPPGDSAGVWLVDPERRDFITRIIDGTDHGAVAWAPDDRLLVVRQLAHNDYEIVVHALTGQGRSVRAEAVDTLPGGAFLHSVASSRDGAFLYGADGRIWRGTGGIREPVPFRATVSVLRPRYDRRVPDLGAGAGDRDVRIALEPAISPDGQRIAFAALGDLWVTDLAGNVQALTAGGVFPRHPAWSPDGKWIAFASLAAAGHAIWVADANGSGVRRLTELPGSQTQPRWSPDGRRIAFQCQPFCAPGMMTTIGWVPVAGDPARLVHGGPWGQGVVGEVSIAGWTGDGEHIVFHGRRLHGPDHPERAGGPERAVPWGRRLWAVPADSGAVVPWGPVLPMHHPTITPDGGAVLYQTAGSLWRIPATPDGVGDSTAPERIVDEFADWPTASANGRYIAYFSPDGLTRLDTETGGMERLRVPLAYTLQHPPPMVVRGVRLFDGTGAPPTGPVDVWMAQGRIERITPAGVHAPSGDRLVVDGRGAFALPGLIDGHVHPSIAAMPALLNQGVTTARDAGTNLLAVLGLRETIESGALPGPRLIVAGPAVDPAVNDPGDPGIDNIEMARRYIERAATLGADAIKLYNIALPVEEVIRAAHEAGLPVISHGEGALVGLDGKEHAFGTRFYSDWIELHAHAGPALGSTLTIIFDIEHYASPDLERIHEFARDGLDFVRRVHESGGRIVAGTDVGSLHRELELLVLAGLQPAEALYTATGGAARILGIEEHAGTVQPGRVADLVILEPGADPLTDIRETIRIWKVIQGGRVVDGEGLLEWARENQQSGGQR